MTLNELKAFLATLETVHALTAEGIIALRERIANVDKFTSTAIEVMNAQLAQRIGAAQLLADKLPDFRAFA